MRLLILSTEFPPGPGGLGTLAYQIGWYLAKAGWQVVVSTPQDHAGWQEIDAFNASQPFDVVRLKRLEPSVLEGAYRLVKALRIVSQGRPDIVLAVGMQAVWLGALLSLSTEIPLVAVGGGSEFLANTKIERVLTHWAFGRAQSPIAISHYVRGLMSQMGIKTAQVKVIPPGADAGVYRPGLPVAELRSRLKLGDSKVILTVGQVSERKAQDVVIKALTLALKDCPDLYYLIAGLPTRRAALQQLAESLGVADHVIFLGQVSQGELPHLYNLADVFALVSRRTLGQVEGFGIVAVEAALCGTPAVVSRDCGLEEAVVENETAYVVDPDDPEATARAITRLLTDDELRTRMGQAALHYALEHATWDTRMRQYDALLRSLLTEAE